MGAAVCSPRAPRCFLVVSALAASAPRETSAYSPWTPGTRRTAAGSCETVPRAKKKREGWENSEVSMVAVQGRGCSCGWGCSGGCGFGCVCGCGCGCGYVGFASMSGRYVRICFFLLCMYVYCSCMYMHVFVCTYISVYTCASMCNESACAMYPFTVYVLYEGMYICIYVSDIINKYQHRSKYHYNSSTLITNHRNIIKYDQH